MGSRIAKFVLEIPTWCQLQVGCFRSEFGRIQANCRSRAAEKGGLHLTEQLATEIEFNFFQIKPIVDQIYKFNEMPQAYERVENGHLRGKIVVEIVADQ